MIPSEIRQKDRHLRKVARRVKEALQYGATPQEIEAAVAQGFSSQPKPGEDE